ncbi:hypothetical protein COY90_00420 [Candidatus Roizmanbacteria bacterium CG_4_10_14_0_8_um_filter_39_9]|uniref:Type II toxin-antitoxin system mRNA interferase toxin, RelE/StbE family n=1 Tax=Candidatus Roizmanbacteria bacterium CG_4_10_14_0_8_um_filter_39_9 TaxID=1974829 RepID=A0A2M7QF50_9BACT|nr:MAG: hypothetical protein COY90_00420 [Candidatus Roizmanbacteria bacterium CG_4_10_14_0_8_um_filter_39_9]
MEIILSHDASKQYKRLPISDKTKINKKLITLYQDPYGGKKLAGELEGIRSLRVWPYCILYAINKKTNMVEMHKIAHRQSVYK